MSFGLKPRRTLAARLTLWYAAIFTLTSAIAFSLFFVLIASVIRTRIDQDLARQANDFSHLLGVQGLTTLKRVAILEAQASGEKKIFIRLLRWNGEAFSSSNMVYWKDIGIRRSALKQLNDGVPKVFETVVIPDERHKVRILYQRIGPGVLLQLGQSLEQYTHFIQAFQKIFVATMLLLICFAALLGWFMARRALGGVAAVTRAAGQIAAGDFDRRVPVRQQGDEVDQLASTFNHMIDRIETLLTSMKEMSDNIAHDLRSPLTRIRGLAEVTLTTGTSLDDYQKMAASTVEDCDRLLDIINTMLMISKTETGIDHLAGEPVDLGELVATACDLFQPMAEDEQVRLDCQAAQAPIRIMGDVNLLQRMVANVLDNAIKYTPAGGRVTCRLETQRDESAAIVITDTGSGISPAELPHIFERFYRADRSRSATGTGLGLSLAQAIARAHGGDITATSQIDRGSSFKITLPFPLEQPPRQLRRAARRGSKITKG